MSSAAERRERRKQRVTEGGQDRLQRIQATMYKSMQPDATDANVPPSTEEPIEKEMSTPATQKKNVPSEQSSTESLESVPTSSLESLLGSTESFLPMASPLGSNFSINQDQPTSGARQTPEKLFGRQELIMATVSGILAALWTVYSVIDANVDAHVWEKEFDSSIIRRGMKQLSFCLQHGCTEMEWDQRGVNLTGFFLMSQMTILAVRMLIQGRKCTPMEALRLGYAGMIAFMFAFTMCQVAVIQFA